KAGLPLAVALKDSVQVLPAWSSVGLHTNAPEGEKAAPVGAPVRVNATVSPSVSVAFTVKVNVVPALMLIDAGTCNEGGWFVEVVGPVTTVWLELEGGWFVEVVGPVTTVWLEPAVCCGSLLSAV